MFHCKLESIYLKIPNPLNFENLFYKTSDNS